MGDLADNECRKGDAGAVMMHFLSLPVPWRVNEESVIVDFGSGFGKFCLLLSLLAAAKGFRPRRIVHVEIVGSYLAVDARVLKEVQASEEGAVPVGGGEEDYTLTHQEVKLM